MKYLLTVLSGILFACVSLTAADLVLVDNGQPRAEIVIAEQPQRTVRLAAQELQDYVKKISGAHLPIVTKPGGQAASIFVGHSPHTEALKLNAEGLKEGAYRIVSGDHWLALIGDDTDFNPIEPWARSNADIRSGKLQSEWDKITGATWGVPNTGMYKNRIKLPGSIGKPEGMVTDKAESLDLWGFDERGSFNAVCGLLMKLGVRWYLPGETGEVVPAMKTLQLPPLDETVRPDFPVRRFNVRFGTNGKDTALWSMHLGMRDPNGLQVAHGMETMTGNDAIFAAHPDWFALYGGKRHYTPGYSKNQLCYSNEELFQESVRYARTLFDHYDLESVSIMPPDGYTSICQCERCKGKDAPERADRGHLSDYVWDFVNRVAKEVGKTHPQKKILCCAYGAYTSPPLKIARLEPNVLVCIVGGRRPTSDKPEQQAEIRKLRDDWVAKTSNPILIFENYPFTDRGWYLPSYVPHTIGAGINATKGISQGEDIWLSMRQDFDSVGIGYNHFPVYFTARMYWGGKEADVDAMFREYCRLFYGPAEQEMHTFFTYCEANWQEMEKEKEKADQALAFFAKAKLKADAASLYGKRLALIDDYLQGLRNKSQQLGQKRGPVPSLRLVGEARDIVIDGKLDDAYWQSCPVASTGSLRELQTGRTPTFGTTIKSGWVGGSVYFAIRCNERPGEKPNNTATKEDDAALWYGDAIEILLETESHSYYQIAVSPSGVIADLDRSAARGSWFSWDSQAEVATHIADDHWTVEIRIPVTQDENDPLHQVIGHKPTQSLPWHFNVCRQRIRENGTELSAFSPTGTDNFHHVLKFAHFYDGRSHQFEAAEPEDDYLKAAAVAGDMLRNRKYEEAMTAFVSLGERKLTDFQKSAAFEQAAACARALQKYEAADDFAARIPMDAVKKTTRMQNLLAQQKAPEVIRLFGSENIDSWPFWKQGDGYFTRGRAHTITRAGKEAVADFTHAVEFTGDVRTRQSIQLAHGNACELLLKDDNAALPVYRAIFDSLSAIGSTDEYTAVQAAARILTRQGKYDDALTTLNLIDTKKTPGIWRHSTLLSRAGTLTAAGRKDEALKIYEALLADPTVEPRQRKIAEESLRKK